MTEREIVLRLLIDLESSDKYANLALSSHVTDSLSKDGMSRVTSLFYTVIEHKLTYDYYIGAISERELAKIDAVTKNILRLGMAQIIHIDSIPDFAAVSETVKLGRHKGEKAFVNGVLRKTVRLKNDNSLPMPKREKNAARYMSFAYSFPVWMVKHFISLYGEAGCEELLQSFLDSRYVDLTVNTLKISREKYLQMLTERGVSATLSPRSPVTVRIMGSVDPRSLPGFGEGYFIVQDEACAVSILALSPLAGERIADVCSAPGGKSFLSAILSGDGADIRSYDLHESKLSLITDGKDRLGLSSVLVSVRDATKPDESLFDTFDKVICDVPCSGLGVLSKKADLKYRTEDSLSRLPELQYEILSKSAKYLRPGGCMIYSTCTLNPRENEDIVERFLHENREFAPVDFEIGDIRSKEGKFTFIPSVHQTDGFFIAKLKKEN